MSVSLQPASRVRHLRAEGAYHVLAQAQALEREGRDIIHLEVGEPDARTFDNIQQAGVAAIQAGKTRYNPPAGMPELRRAIAEVAGRQRSLPITPDQVIVSPGAKPNMFFPTLALVEPGDEVLYPDPGFPTYAAMIGVAGGIPVPVPLNEENQFSFDLKAFERLIGPRTKLIILNSPANPTGGVIPPSDLEYLAEAADRYDCWILSDEIYARLVYDGVQAVSIASLPGMAERTIIVDGFSKTYAMTGWRLGFGIMPEPLARVVELLITHSVGCSAHFTQIAAVEALRGPQDQVEALAGSFRVRRNRLVEGLNAIPGISCQRPQGAFYVFPNIRALGLGSDEVADRLLREVGVALLPGTAFGTNGEGYLRLSYANSMDNLERALDRIGTFVRNL
ncbi:MAG TPA: pyridoxal phosphate-dependent aminotransferase [Anaerolineales bacterium]|nr:pyridoxal phosphate-dependent aminotransferase [Anaerolineales bacterium]